MTAGVPLGDLESFSTFRNGERFSAKDFNFWGVTFARDGNTFYASLRTSGTTYLVRGDIAARRLTVLRDNVECPSVSPDDRFVAFKKYIGPDPNAWRIAVVELATMKERLVTGETRYIDDQVEWLDADRLLYGITRRTTSIADVWVVSATGDASATVLLQQAESPTVVR
jgi:dipeptidyl aminopeptidase/acylaminoacyl peptidase